MTLYRARLVSQDPSTLNFVLTCLESNGWEVDFCNDVYIGEAPALKDFLKDLETASIPHSLVIKSHEPYEGFIVFDILEKI